MAKDSPRQIPMGTCGCKITRIKRGRKFHWYCQDTHGYETKLERIALAVRGKAK